MVCVLCQQTDLELWRLSFPRQSGGAVNVIRASVSFGFDLRDVFPYDLLPDQLRPMGLLLGQVSKWRAQRADRGVRATASFSYGKKRTALRSHKNTANEMTQVIRSC